MVGIDAGAVAGGAAGRNGGFLLAGGYPFYHDAVERWGRERARTVYRLTLEEMDRIEAAVPGAVRRVGSLRIAASAEEAEDCARQREAMLADDLAVERYRGPEGEGLLIPTDGAFDPLQRCRLLAERGASRRALASSRAPPRPRSPPGR